MSAIYFRANLLTFPLFWDPLVLAVHLLNCIASFQLKMPTYTAVVPYPRKKTSQTMLLTHRSQNLFRSCSVFPHPFNYHLSSLLPTISHTYSWDNYWNPRFALSLIILSPLMWLTLLPTHCLAAWCIYNYLFHLLEYAFASFRVCCKWYDFDKLSNNQQTFSIFCSFPLSYSYSDTICSTTVHTELALFSLKTSLFRDL